jgi:hypothetical protein
MALAEPARAWRRASPANFDKRSKWARFARIGGVNRVAALPERCQKRVLRLGFAMHEVNLGRRASAFSASVSDRV